MAFLHNITPIIAIAGTIVIIGVAVLCVLSPLPIVFYNFLHQQGPDDICLYPPIEKQTMGSIWDAITRRTGIDNNSAIFDEMQVQVTRDETIDNLELSFHATKNGKWQQYSVYMDYNPDRCGTLRIRANPLDSPESSGANPGSPREFLGELTRIKPSVFGISNQSARISTGVSHEISTSYTSQTCTDLFLLKNGTLSRLVHVTINNSTGVLHWDIFPQHCFATPQNGYFCSSGNSILVFPDQQSEGADIIALPTGTDLPLAIHECPSGPVEGQSCTKTLWGENCINWTEP